ncbi:MAG: hypothetical protein WC374_06335 [Phycisphaerae bacterium]|jgi:hypothetical protein
MGGYGKSGSSVIAKQAAVREEARFVPTVHPSEESLAIRKRLERHLAAWLKHYFPDVFFWKHGPVQLSGISKLEQCINEGGCFCVVWPRGDGKSVVGKGAAIYAALTGRRRFLVCIGATNDLALDYMEFIQKNLSDNRLLMADYPECMGFFKALGWKAIKARNQLTKDIGGKLVSTGIRWRPRTVTFPTILDPAGKPYPFAGAIIETRGITATVKGISRATAEGEVIRPDFVLADDLQDPETAASDVLCDKMERAVMGDILPLAGPQTQIACYMPTTIMRKGDVSSRFVDRARHPEFQGEKHPMVINWPKAQDMLWKEYADLRVNADSQREGKKMAHKFYLKNKKAMDEGAETSWPARVRKGESSAIETAENLLIELKEQFWAECQGEPLEASAGQYNLTVEMVCAHAVAGRPRLTLPDACHTFTGLIDINKSKGGLHWCVAGFDQGMTAHIPAYGHYPDHGELWPKNANEQFIQQSIYSGLKAVCDRIAATGFILRTQRVQPDLVLIDAGFKPDPVHRFASWAKASGSYRFMVMPSIGRAAHRYNYRKDTLIGRPFEGCHIQRNQNDPNKFYLMFNSDFWRETSQRAFLSEPGAPGGCTLYAASQPREHHEFAAQVVAEKIFNKYDTPMGTRWEWHHAPGSQWDWGDALTGCWVGAAAKGLSASGQAAPAQARARNMRQVRHIAI